MTVLARSTVSITTMTCAATHYRAFGPHPACRIEPEGTAEIASRARGTPRIANRLLRRVRDYAQVRADGVITRPVAQAALDALEIDYLGLDPIDRRYLSDIIQKFSGGPVGVETLAASLSEATETIEDVIEPFLLHLGFIARTTRGRVATRGAYLHLGLPPKEEQASLWSAARHVVVFPIYHLRQDETTAYNSA